MKKFFTLTIFLIIALVANMSFAATTTSFEVVEDNVCTIKLNEYCEFEKKMISSDLEKRQVTMQMKVTNNSTDLQPTGEVMLVIDNSSSMLDATASGDNRKDLVFNSAIDLVNKMLEGNDNLKVGAVSFSTNTDVAKEGTIEDAALASELTSDASSLANAILNIQTTGARTDLDAGITLASQYFSNENTNKYIIVLTDGVPNVALDYDGTYFSDDVITKTKSKLQALANNYNIITMLTGIDNADATVTGSTYTYAQYIEQIFGTTENPTVGKFYYIEDDKIENTIKEDIYNDLLPVSQAITDIVVYDYFPQDIVDNFEFAYVSDPSIGTITPTIDTENNCIIWNIDSLASGETAIVQYTLTLKDNYSKDIVGVILDTNEKVDITYKDFDGTDKNVTSDETPKVRVLELVGDETTAKTVLPKTGTPILIAGACILGLALVISGARYIVINKKINK